MRLINIAVPGALLSVVALAQVYSPAEISDPAMRELQQKYFAELKQVTITVAQRDFPYHFYYSRILDLSEKEQHASDQRSVQFDRYHDQTVLKITGNYFASYSTDLMTPEQRARQTYQDVMLPLLQAAVPIFATAPVPDAFAFEISHHIRKKVIGVTSEGVENVVLVLPKAAAIRLITATNAEAKIAAVSEGQVFLNAAPIELWPGTGARSVQTAPSKATATATSLTAGTSPVSSIDAGTSLGNSAAGKFGTPSIAQGLPSTTASLPVTERDTSPDALKRVQDTYQVRLDRMVQELNGQAHFVRYAPPAFIPFHKGLFLQLSLSTPLAHGAGGSQYKLAALAFDQHIAHLIRPALEPFKESSGDFDGLDFSTSVRTGSEADAEGSAIAVEFIFPLPALRAYAQFDLTGQQLIDAGYVLINGERVSLNLQAAEADTSAR